MPPGPTASPSRRPSAHTLSPTPPPLHYFGTFDRTRFGAPSGASGDTPRAIQAGAHQSRDRLGAHRAERRRARAGRRARPARAFVRRGLLHSERRGGRRHQRRVYLLGAGDYGASRSARRTGARGRPTPVRWLQMGAPQPKPAGAERDTFFPKGARCRRRRRGWICATCAGSLLGHFDASQIPPVRERQNVAQGPRGRVPEVADRRELRRRAPPAAVHRVPARRRHRPARPHLRRGLLHPERRGRGHDGREDLRGHARRRAVDRRGLRARLRQRQRAAGDVARDVCAAAAERERVPLHGGMGDTRPKSWRDRTHDVRHSIGRTRPFTGAEYLESLRDGREIWIYGETRQGRHDPSGVPQHRADDRAALRRAARSGAARTC